MQKADLLIALGARFDDRVTGKVDGFAPDAKIIHVDIDPAELGKVRRPDVPIVGDCRLVIEELIKAVRELERRKHGAARPSTRGSTQLSGWQEQLPAHATSSSSGGPLKPQFVHRARCATTRPTTRIVVVGRRPAPDVDAASTGSSTTPTRGSTPAASARWASRCRRRSAPRSAGPTAWCGRSTATAASR